MTVILQHELHCEWCTATITLDYEYGYRVGGMGKIPRSKDA